MLVVSLLATITPLRANADTSPFEIVVKTDNPGTSADNQFTIPTYSYYNTYNYNVDCDLDHPGTNMLANQTGDAICTYATPGTYTVAITGTFPAIYFNNTGDKDKLVDIKQWGTNQWQSMIGAFYGATNLTTLSATDTPDMANVTGMDYMFRGAAKFNSDISTWDVSSVTSMYGVFWGAILFNQPLNNWDVSNVTNMAGMFLLATSFNQPLNNWNVSNVTSMYSMLDRASAFNQSLGDWDISNVTFIRYAISSSGLSYQNYEDTLVGWSQLPTVPHDLELDALKLHYCGDVATSARQSLIDDFGWVINGDSKCGPPSTISLIAYGLTGNVSKGTVLGDLAVADSGSDNPSVVYSLACAAPGVNDGDFTLNSAGALVATHDLVNTTDAAITYTVCIRATNADGRSADLSLSITQRPQAKITGVSFSQNGNGLLMTISGQSMTTGLESPLTNSPVSLNNSKLPLCTYGLGLTADQLIAYGYVSDASVISDTPPCYYYTLDGVNVAYSATQFLVWLPDSFDTNAEGSVSINGTTSIFNKKHIVASIHVNSVNNLPISKKPTIPARPMFSGVTHPWSHVRVEVHSDPVVCETDADGSGNWSCALPRSLPSGTHTVLVTATLPDKSTEQMGPYTVVVADKESTPSSGQDQTVDQGSPTTVKDTGTNSSPVDSDSIPQSDESTVDQTDHKLESTVKKAPSNQLFRFVLAAAIVVAILALAVVVRKRHLTRG